MSHSAQRSLARSTIDFASKIFSVAGRRLGERFDQTKHVRSMRRGPAARQPSLRESPHANTESPGAAERTLYALTVHWVALTPRTGA